MLTDWRSRRRAVADEGFTLIEAIAAIAVAALMLTAVAFAAVTGIHGSTEARINQQAGDVIESAIESARAQSYDNLVMSGSDSTLATDPRLTTSGCPGATPCVSVPKDDGSGTVKESIVEGTGGYISTHIQTDTTGTNKVKFTVSTYITSPSDEASASYKRVLVYVDWTVYGQKHTREASTFVTDTTRGLPLPNFKLTLTSQPPTITTLPGSATFGFQLANLGARDAFDFTSDNETLGWTYYLGPAGANSLDTSTDTLLTDSDGDGVRDSGEMDPNSSVTLWATRLVPTGTANGTSTVKFTATSVAQPGLGAGVSTQSQATTVTVQTSGVVTPTPTTTTTASATPSPTPTGSCARVGSAVPSGVGYYLHNTTDGSAFPGTTWSTTVYPMQFSKVVPTATTLQNYSHELANSGSPIGRNIAAATPSFTNTNSAQVAAWQYQVTNVAKKSSATFSGTTYLDIWAEPSSGSSSDTVSLQAMVGYSNNNTNNFVNETSSTATATGTGCGTWREFVIAIPTTTITAGNNDYLELLLFNAGSSDVRVAYDVTNMSSISAVYWQQS